MLHEMKMLKFLALTLKLASKTICGFSIILCVTWCCVASQNAVIVDFTTNSSTLIFPSGAPFKLVCLLDDVTCSMSSPDDVLQLSPKHDVTGCNGTQGGCSATCQVEDATKLNTDDYICWRNGIQLTENKVFVIDKPAEPRVQNIYTTEYKDIFIVFETGPSDFISPDEVKVTLKEGRKDAVEICSANCSSNGVDTNRVCTCLYSQRETRISNNSVILSILVARPSLDNPIQSAEWKRTVNLLSYIVPGPPVLELDLWDVSDNKAVAVFRPSEVMRRMVVFMESIQRPLQFHVLLNKTQGNPELTELRFVKKVYYNRELYEKLYVALEFDNLTAFTNYNLCVSSIGGGGEGPMISSSFQTRKAVPKQPPEMEDFMFSRAANSQGSSLLLYWKPLPHECAGGINLTYELQISSTKGYNSTVQNIETSYLFISSGLPQDALVVKLWAVNEIGKSENFSQIHIPAAQGASLLESVVEYVNESMMFVYLNGTSVSKFEQVAVHWCQVSTNTLQKEICLDYPTTRIMTRPDSENGQPMKFEINLTQHATGSLIYQTQVQVHDLFDNTSIIQTSKVNATVTMNEYPPQVDIPQLFDYRPETRKRRAVSQTSNSKRSVLPRPVGGTQKVFISVKVNGSWMGMAAANYLFDSSLEEATALLSRRDADGKQILRMKQLCNTDKAKQFLIRSFVLFSSGSENCSTSELTWLGNLTNLIFSPNEMPLPIGLKFVCVQLTRSDGFNLFTNYQVESEVTDDLLTTSSIILICVLTAFGIVVVSLFIYVLRICQIRRKRAFKLNEGSPGQIPEIFTTNSSANGCYTNDAMDSTIDSEGPSRDSGQGTSIQTGNRMW
ncbi:uncharacterized protein LOC131954260 [Physella acuta]|uniref:uncharacterized protein LOC131954260 n=1 Tax=Physella acuta TaxID=109671 RepID=UPI0027DBEE0C|nr:uncharacterized protein LOC131954260 [Physella acuta]